MGYDSEMDGCGKFMKKSLFIVNFIVFIGGVTLVGLSTYALISKVHYVSELSGASGSLLSGTVYILLVSGIVVCIVSFLGCYGALREIRCMLFMYFLILLLLFVVILIGGILGYVYREKFVDSLRQTMTNTLPMYESKKNIREAWDVVQRELQCCGVDSYNNWQNYVDSSHFPRSCCKRRSTGTVDAYFDCAQDGQPTPALLHMRGCLNSVKDFLQGHAATLGAAGITLAVIIFLGMIFSCALFKMIR